MKLRNYALGAALLVASCIPSIAQPAPSGVAALALPDYSPADAGAASARLFHSMRVDGEAPAASDVQVITSNAKAWWIRWRMIERAERSIDITYFIIKDDIFGLSLLGLLAQKARQGVNIRFMLDSRGSKSLSSVFWGRGYLKQLSKFPTVDIRVFNPLSKALLRLPKDIRHAVASNHDKILAVDDEWVLTGGRNIAREYFVPYEDDPKAYRDTDILIRGREATARARRAFHEEFEVLKNSEIKLEYPGWTPKAYKLELARQIMDRFLVDGTFYGLEQIGSKLRKLAKDLHEELEKMPGLAGYARWETFRGECRHPTVILDKSSFAHKYRNDITLNLIRLIDSARHSLVIQNPYIILTDEMKGALIRATKRGVRLVIHTNSPDSSDSLLPQAFFLRDWKEILRLLPGAEIYASRKRTLHAKVMIVDDRVSVVGTYNLDALSQAVNSEVVAVVESREFAIEQRRRIAQDTADSHRYYLRQLPDGSWEEHGPQQHFKGLKSVLVKLLSRWDWLKRVV